MTCLPPPKPKPAQLMETLVELQARYDALLLSTPNPNPPTMAAVAGATNGAVRVAELEAALQEKEGRLKAAEVRVRGVVGGWMGW